MQKMEKKQILKSDLFFIRFLIFVQIVTALWFWISPSGLPVEFEIAEKINDKKMYEYIDSIVVYMGFVKLFFCVALYWPSRIFSVLFFITSVLIEIISFFGGSAAASPIDMLIGYIQLFSSGMMFGILWVYGFFKIIYSNDISAK